MLKLISAIILFATPAICASDVLVSTNPNFDQSGGCSGSWDSLDQPCATGYYGYQPDSDDTTFGVVQHYDSNVVVVGIDQATGYTRAGITQRVENPNVGESYRFSALVKAEDLIGQVRLVITEIDLNGVSRITHEMYGPTGSSSWQKVEITRTTPPDTLRLDFTVMVSTNLGGTQCASECGQVLVDSYRIEKLFNTTADIEGIANPCSEGDFLSPRSRSCMQLDKGFGFSKDQFDLHHPSLLVELSPQECNQSFLSNALSLIHANGGGTVRLPKCTIELTSTIWLSSNTLIEGAGSGRTILHIPNWQTSSIGLIRIENPLSAVVSRPEVQNVIIRDLTIIESESIEDESVSFIVSSDSQNILLERLELSGSSRSNISFNRTQMLTVRYVFSEGAYWHGIGTKDCFPSSQMDQDEKDGLISRYECDSNSVTGGPLFWTENISIYSAELYQNHGNGLDSHASSVEVAGNRILQNRYGSKFPEPAKEIWIHDNIFESNQDHGSASKTQYCYDNPVDNSMQSKDHVYYRNSYINNSDLSSFAFRVDNVENVILLENISYHGNGNLNRARVAEPCASPLVARSSSVYYCSGDIIGEGSWSAPSGLAPQLLLPSDPICELNSVSSLFD